MDNININGREYKVGDSIVYVPAKGYYKGQRFEQIITEIVSNRCFKAKFPNMLKPDTYTFGAKCDNDMFVALCRGTGTELI